MKAPQEVMDAWKLQREHGDVAKISEESDISKQTISNALNSGRMDQTTFDAIAAYYKNKKSAEKELIDKTING